MISPQKALEIILKQANRLPDEIIDTRDSLGRILAQDIRAGIDMPPFDKSAMDGFAVRSLDLQAVPRWLKIVEVIKAGDVAQRVLRKNECAKIMTGARIPKGADSVVMVENTRKETIDTVEILKSVEKNENVCFKGENFKRGMKLLQKDCKINMAELAVLVSQGINHVKVFRRPRVSILSTGNEILLAKQKIAVGKIKDSNGPMLSAKCREMGLDVKYLGIAQDHVSSLSKKIKQALRGDVLIISGAVSVSEVDLVPKALRYFNIKPLFHNVSMKPGKPLLFSKRGNFLVFGLPGNPVSSLLGFLLFIQYALKKMSGEKGCSWHLDQARLVCSFRQKPGRTSFYPCRIIKKGSRNCLQPISYAGSGDIYAITKADAFMIIDKQQSFVPKNSICDFVRLRINE